MQIKHQIGKLALQRPLTEIIRGQQRMNDIDILPAELDHVLALEQLPMPHNDPFDRLLIAQATIEEAVLVSKDQVFSAYPVRVLW